jgi:hypothetical protein
MTVAASSTEHLDVIGPSPAVLAGPPSPAQAATAVQPSRDAERPDSLLASLEAAIHERLSPIALTLPTLPPSAHLVHADSPTHLAAVAENPPRQSSPTHLLSPQLVHADSLQDLHVASADVVQQPSLAHDLSRLDHTTARQPSPALRPLPAGTDALRVPPVAPRIPSPAAVHLTPANPTLNRQPSPTPRLLAEPIVPPRQPSPSPPHISAPAEVARGHSPRPVPAPRVSPAHPVLLSIAVSSVPVVRADDGVDSPLAMTDPPRTASTPVQPTPRADDSIGAALSGPSPLDVLLAAATEPLSEPFVRSDSTASAVSTSELLIVFATFVQSVCFWLVLPTFLSLTPAQRASGVPLSAR